jgi:multicomponent Na+:H+ antiporter subunit E
VSDETEGRTGTSARTASVRAVARWLGLLALWIILVGDGFTHVDAVDGVVGVVVAAAATWTSLRLWPAGMLRFGGPATFARLVARLLRQSLGAGWDIARRAFHPTCPLAPGTLDIALPIGSEQSGFRAFSSLMPGTLPVDDAAQAPNAIRYHCLDREAPVAEELARDCTLWRAAFDAEPPRGAP